jgi:hypothetical protein
MSTPSNDPCGNGVTCTKPNECCSGYVGSSYYNTCGISNYYCWATETQIDLCGPCTNPNHGLCFRGATARCPKQVDECGLSEWGACSATENGFRKRTILKTARNGKTCPPDSELRQACSNCVLSPWSSCLEGIQTKTITTPSTNGGVACPPESSLRQDCGTNCVLSEWSSCAENGTRTRTIITKSANGGKACPSLAALTETCPFNCVVTDWTNCIEGNRTRRITKAKAGTGTCPQETNLSEACGTNCVLDVWTPCSNGTRTRSIKINMAGGGRTCPIETDPLRTQECGTNCVVSNWSSCAEELVRL